MKKLLAILLLGLSTLATAQTVQTTPNVISTTVSPGVPGVTQSWSGFIPTTSTGGGFSGGDQPGYNPSTGQFMFGFTQATIGYTMAINSALAGSGVQIGGMNYGLKYFNQQDYSGTLSVTAAITSNTGAILQSYSHNLPLTTNGWTQWGQTQTFTTPHSLANLGNATLSFTGKDSRFWAGYYGPQFKDPYLTFNYTVDPCVTNPAYSPSCPNFNTVVISPNLLSGVTGPQAYAINEALSAAGAGAMIHGFNYGYNYNVAGRQCAVWDIFGFCITGFNYSDAGVATVITDSNNATIYGESNTHNGGDNGTSGTYAKQFRFGSSLPRSTLGAFAMSPWTSGNASITNMYSNAVYTPDPCVVNPLSSTSCLGYQQAYFTQQCTISPLYNNACPGYAEAVFTQQCNANQLSDPRCPGYAAAYLVQQCTINPMYSTTCQGYDTAVNECNSNPLSHSYCPAYQTATVECSSNPLYGSYCPMYSTASLECSTNPLSHSYCPMYQTSTTQCAASALYASYCPGYEFAYACQQDGLYSKQCPNYAEAYAKKSLLTNLAATTVTESNTSATSTTTSSTSTVTTTEAITTQLSSGITDTTVSSVVTTKTTTTNSDTAPAAAVKLTSTTSSTSTPTAPVAVAQAETKKEEAKKEETKKEESKKEEGSKQNASGPSGGAGSDSKPSDQPKTNREALAERRREAAQKDAVAKGANLANEMGKAADMEAQKAVQNVVIQAMGFTPGFDTYNKAMLPDGVGYKPYTVYGNQRNIDTPNSRRLLGGSDRTHEQMVDSQYQLGR